MYFFVFLVSAVAVGFISIVIDRDLKIIEVVADSLFGVILSPFVFCLSNVCFCYSSSFHHYLFYHLDIYSFRTVHLVYVFMFLHSESSFTGYDE